MDQGVSYVKISSDYGVTKGAYHVCHHEQVALNIIPSSSEGRRPERSDSRVRMRFVAAADFPASSTLEMRSWAKSELCLLHYVWL
jgi:hypothetical protein